MWGFPAAGLLGLPEQGTQASAVQEIAALPISKMPAPAAAQVVERLTGVKVSAATLARAARVQGQRAREKHQSLDARMSTPEGRQQQDRDLHLPLPTRAAKASTNANNSRSGWKERPKRACEKEVNYLQSHRQRMDYGTAQKKGEPLGRRAMESTCRQYRARFKWSGQFWSQTGDEALMCLETFRRNGR